ncbi:hypothetical protein RND81_06G182200 [Saponaria officinalis]|uniref:Uncharacterized protein n=1 Tax=Saponaria officinalis TaxID=3572 RepID=A0AAW1K7P4_SAPOF
MLGISLERSRGLLLLWWLCRTQRYTCLMNLQVTLMLSKQRLKAAQVVRSLLRPNSFVIVVEHDLSVLDYLPDFICCLYGKPGAYEVVTLPFSVREGINIFLSGFVPTENRFILVGICRDLNKATY